MESTIKFEEIRAIIDQLPDEPFHSVKVELVAEAKLMYGASLEGIWADDIRLAPDMETFKQTLSIFVQIILYVNTQILFLPKNFMIQPLSDKSFDFEAQSDGSADFDFLINVQTDGSSAYIFVDNTTGDDANEDGILAESAEYLDPIISLLQKISDRKGQQATDDSTSA